VRSMTKWRIPLSKPRLIALSVIGVALAILPLVVESPYILHLAIMALIYAALGMTFSMLFSTGLISLGCAAFYAVGAYTSALLVMKLGLSFWLALPLATMITGVIALGIGSVIVRYPGAPFVLVTLVLAVVTQQTAGQVELFGGWGGIMDIPSPSIGALQFTGKIPYYYLLLFLFGMIVLVFQALYSSRIGRAWKSIQLSDPLAKAVGINAYRYRVSAFTIASSAAGLMGSFYAHYFQTITPDITGGWVSIYIQLYAVLGGIGFYILGPALGASIMVFVPEFLRLVEEFEPVVTGILLIVLIVFFPGGILGTLQKRPRFRLANLSDRIRKIRRWISTGAL